MPKRLAAANHVAAPLLLAAECTENVDCASKIVSSLALCRDACIQKAIASIRDLIWTPLADVSSVAITSNRIWCSSAVVLASVLRPDFACDNL